MNSYRCNPDSPEAQEASRDNERDVFAAQMQATVFDVGTRWPAPGGWCEVARIEDDVAWVREPSHSGTLYRYDLGELRARPREVCPAPAQARRLLRLPLARSRARYGPGLTH